MDGEMLTASLLSQTLLHALSLLPGCRSAVYIVTFACQHCCVSVQLLSLEILKFWQHLIFFVASFKNEPPLGGRGRGGGMERKMVERQS